MVSLTGREDTRPLLYDIVDGYANLRGLVLSSFDLRQLERTLTKRETWLRRQLTSMMAVLRAAAAREIAGRKASSREFDVDRDL